MLFEVGPSGALSKKMQLSSHPQCSLFEQEIVNSAGGGDDDDDDGEKGGADEIVVRYCHAEDGAAAGTLRVPLEPDYTTLKKVDVDLHQSGTSAYRMGDPYDAWFSACLGFPVALIYLGDGKRAILGKTLLPPAAAAAATQDREKKKTGWISSVTSYISSAPPSSDPQPWLTFTDVSPLLVTSEASLQSVNSLLLRDQPMEMYKFRPNLVVDGEGEDAWAEDYWGELALTTSLSGAKHSILLTANCGRCTSLNVDYQTGKQAEGELGTVLKKLMRDRRVDTGAKWNPIFGRYATIAGVEDSPAVLISVGDEVKVVQRIAERTVFDWP